MLGVGIGLTRGRKRRDAYGVVGFKPPFVLDFEKGYFRVSGTSVTFSQAVTHSRMGNATMVDGDGNLVTVASGVPRLNHHIHDGSAWVNQGLLHESAVRTNLLLDSRTLSSQSVTVTAAPHTLHFTGTGTITLSGASTAGPLVGTGTGEQNRASLTFTPSAGTLGVTVSGTVADAQLEVGATASSYIPTAGSTATRAADMLSVPAAKLPWNVNAVSMQMSGRMTYADINDVNELVFILWAKDNANYIRDTLRTNTGSGTVLFRQKETVSGDDLTSGTGSEFSPGIYVPFNFAARHGSTLVNGAITGTVLTADLTPTALPDLSATNLDLGPTYSGTIKRLTIWADDIGDVGIQEATQ